jgi:hypothetical protein
MKIMFDKFFVLCNNSFVRGIHNGVSSCGRVP